jgi:hypothetical protein
MVTIIVSEATLSVEKGTIKNTNGYNSILADASQVTLGAGATIESNENGTSYSHVIDLVNSKLEVNGATITGTWANEGVTQYGTAAINAKNSTVEINSGKITFDGSTIINATDNSKVTVNDATKAEDIETKGYATVLTNTIGNGVALASGADLVFNNGSMVVFGAVVYTQGTATEEQAATTIEITIEAGSLKATNSSAVLIFSADATEVKVNGGTLEVAESNRAVWEDLAEATEVTVTISGEAEGWTNNHSKNDVITVVKTETETEETERPSDGQEQGDAGSMGGPQGGGDASGMGGDGSGTGSEGGATGGTTTPAD